MSHTTKLHAETVMGLEQQTLWKRMSKSKKEELDRFQTSMVSKLQHIIYICVVYGLTINNEAKDKPESTPIQSADSKINSKDRDEDQPEPEQQPETDYETTDLNPSWPDNAEDGEPASSEEGAEFARTIRNLHSIPEFQGDPFEILRRTMLRSIDADSTMAAAGLGRPVLQTPQETDFTHEDAINMNPDIIRNMGLFNPENASSADPPIMTQIAVDLPSMVQNLLSSFTNQIIEPEFNEAITQLTPKDKVESEMSQKLAVHEREFAKTVEKLTEQYTQQHEANLAEERLAEEISVQAKALTDINKCETTHFTSVEQQKLSEKAKEITDRLDDIQTRLKHQKGISTNNEMLITRIIKSEIPISPTNTQNMSSCKLETHKGNLKASDLTGKSSPRTANMLSTFIRSILTTYPTQLSSVIGPMLRVLKESSYGSYKSKPPSLYDERRLPGCIRDKILPSVYFDRYVEESRQLWDLIARAFDSPLRTTLRPYRTCGSNDNDSTIQAVPGDIVTAVYILLDRHEKNGWHERQTYRDLYMHASSKLESEANIKHTILQLRKPMEEAIRLNVRLDYEVVKRVANTLRRRDPSFTEIIQPYILITSEQARNQGIIHDALPELDRLLSHALSHCDENGITNRPNTIRQVNQASVSAFDQCANAVMGSNWESNGSQSSKLRCAAVGCKEYCSSAISTKHRQFLKKKNLNLSHRTAICDGCFNKLKSKEVESITLFNKKMRTLSKRASANNVDSSPDPTDTTPPDSENDAESVNSAPTDIANDSRMARLNAMTDEQFERLINGVYNVDQ